LAARRAFGWDCGRSDEREREAQAVVLFLKLLERLI
jgi:hypothetical protein